MSMERLGVYVREHRRFAILARRYKYMKQDPDHERLAQMSAAALTLVQIEINHLASKDIIGRGQTSMNEVIPEYSWRARTFAFVVRPWCDLTDGEWDHVYLWFLIGVIVTAGLSAWLR